MLTKSTKPAPPSLPTTKEEALALFEYKDGVLYSKPKPIGSVTGNGYLESKVGKRPFKIHRMIFLMHHGWLPEVVDHIDGNPLNNNIDNLRAATFAQNSYNQKIYKSNLSGIKGVFWCNALKKWQGQISYDKKKYFLGYFENINEAAKVVDEARKLGHKEFARAS